MILLSFWMKPRGVTAPLTGVFYCLSARFCSQVGPHPEGLCHCGETFEAVIIGSVYFCVLRSSLSSGLTAFTGSVETFHPHIEVVEVAGIEPASRTAPVSRRTAITVVANDRHLSGQFAAMAQGYFATMSLL